MSLKNLTFAPLMGRSLLILCILTVLSLGSCRSEFELIRTSNDRDLIYEHAQEYFEKEEYLKAQSLYEIILNTYRGTAKAEQMYFNYAYTHYYLNNYLLAAHYFDNFSNTFVSSPLREEAEFMEGMSHANLSPSFRLDQDHTRQAIDQFQLFVNLYPHSERVGQANELIDEMRGKLEKKLFEEAKLYYDLKDYEAAVQSFENLLRDFPDTDDAEQIRYLVLKAAYLYAENSFYERKEGRYEDALEKYQVFVKKHPDSRYMPEVNDMHRNIVNSLKIFVNE